MSTKNLTVFETTYEKVLSILNKIKDFIIKNTKDYQDIIIDLDWVSEVITNKSIYTYEVKKNKLTSDNQIFLDFITKYNEEILNLNKKHIIVRDIISIMKNKEILQKPSLILKKISRKDLNALNYDENDKTDKTNKTTNSFGKWVMDTYMKNQEEDIESKSNIASNKLKIKTETFSHDKSLTSYKNKKPNYSESNVSSSISSNIKTKYYISALKTIKKKENDFETNDSNLKKKMLNLSVIKKAMEKYYLTVIEEKDKNKKSLIQKTITPTKYRNTNLIKRKEKSDNLNILIEKHFELMKTIIDKDFDLFKLKKLVGYRNVLPLMCHFIFKILGLIDPKIISVKKFSRFLISISNGYLESTLYHNSLHGADVCYSLFLYITNSNIEEICQTTILDLLGLVVSATGHDLGHPGYNNNYHVNSNSELALTYNDISCLENYHASTLFRILRKEENNIFEHMEISDYKQIRKRIVNQILATDMVNHAMVLSCVKAKISAWNMDNIDKNKKFVFLSGVEKTKFDEQQMMLNYLVHTADLAHNTRKFQISIKWVELLTKEFWLQGDIERHKKLSVSFLCDRNDVDVPHSQVGFLNGFILSTFTILVTMFPSLGFTLDNAKNNLKEWQALADQKRKTGWSPNKDHKSKEEKSNKKI